MKVETGGLNVTDWLDDLRLSSEGISPAAERILSDRAVGVGLADLKALLDQDLISLELKRQLLLVAQVMQRCPEFAETAKQAADMLKNSLHLDGF